MQDKRFLNACDVAEIMDVSVATAYKIIRRMNDDLKRQGFVTVSGKISRIYFEEKIYTDLSSERKEKADEKNNNKTASLQ